MNRVVHDFVYNDAHSTIFPGTDLRSSKNTYIRKSDMWKEQEDEITMITKKYNLNDYFKSCKINFYSRYNNHNLILHQNSQRIWDGRSMNVDSWKTILFVCNRRNEKFNLLYVHEYIAYADVNKYPEINFPYLQMGNSTFDKNMYTNILDLLWCYNKCLSASFFNVKHGYSLISNVEYPIFDIKALFEIKSKIFSLKERRHDYNVLIKNMYSEFKKPALGEFEFFIYKHQVNLNSLHKVLYDDHFSIFNHVQYTRKLLEVAQDRQILYPKDQTNIFYNINYIKEEYQTSYFIFLPIEGLGSQSLEDFLDNNKKKITEEAKYVLEKFEAENPCQENVMIKSIVNSIISELILTKGHMICIKQNENMDAIQSIIISATLLNHDFKNNLKNVLEKLPPKDRKFLRYIKMERDIINNVDYTNICELLLQDAWVIKCFDRIKLLIYDCYKNFANRYDKYIKYKNNKLIIFTEGKDYILFNHTEGFVDFLNQL